MYSSADIFLQADDVDSLIRIAMPENRGQDQNPNPEHQPTNSCESAAASSPVFSQISLVWKILDFASSQRLQTGSSLFQASWAATIRLPPRPKDASHDQMVLEDPAIEGSPPADYRTTAGSYAEPPDWFSPEVTSQQPVNDEVPISRPSAALQDVVKASASGAMPLPAPELRQQNLTAEYPGWAWNPASDTGIFYNPFTQVGDRLGASDPSWWDCGNL
jgi:hypothetical protein